MTALRYADPWYGDLRLDVVYVSAPPREQLHSRRHNQRGFLQADGFDRLLRWIIGTAAVAFVVIAVFA
jgi:hypothetical protein